MSKKAPPIYDTKTKLAEAVGVDKSQITRRLRHPGCPIGSSPPWDQQDVDDLKDWIAEGDKGTNDELRKAQAIKARVTALRQSLEMAVMLGRIGRTHAESLLYALRNTTVVHFQQNHFGLSKMIARYSANGRPIDEEEADKLTMNWMRQFYYSWLTTFVRFVDASGDAEDHSSPLLKRLRQIAAEIELMPDLQPAEIQALKELHDQMEMTENACYPDIRKALVPEGFGIDPLPAAYSGWAPGKGLVKHCDELRIFVPDFIRKVLCGI